MLDSACTKKYGQLPLFSLPSSGSTTIARNLENLPNLSPWYDELWYHMQSLWEKNKWARRPFTFVFHDFSHAQPAVYWTLHALILGAFAWWLSPYVLIPSAIWFIQGHVVWAGHKVGEQENPPYVE